MLPDAGLDDEPTDLVLTTGAQVRTLTDAFRLRLLAVVARRPGSAKELAARLDVPTTRLYHHLDLLEEHGFVSVVATRRSGARTERCYGAPPRRSIRPGPELVGAEDRSELARALRALAELTGVALEAAVQAGALQLSVEADRSDERHVVSWSGVRLTREQQAGHAADLAALLRRVVADSSANLDAVDRGEELETELLTLFAVLAPDVTVPD